MESEINESTTNPIRIVIVEDHRVVREGLHALIETQDDMVVVAETGALEIALKTVREQKPDIVVLDLDLGGTVVAQQIPEILEASESARVLVLTGIRDPEIHVRAVRSGALGVVLKDEASGTLLDAIRKVHSGDSWIDHSLATGLVINISNEERKKKQESSKLALLSPREREIITVLCDGLNNREIADKLFISESTVRNHLTSILAKLGLSDRFELAIYAFRYGLAKPPR